MRDLPDWVKRYLREAWLSEKRIMEHEEDAYEYVDNGWYVVCRVKVNQEGAVVHYTHGAKIYRYYD